MIKYCNKQFKDKLLDFFLRISTSNIREHLYCRSEDLQLDEEIGNSMIEYLQYIKCDGEEYSDDEIYSELAEGDETIFISDETEIELNFPYEDYYSTFTTLGNLIYCYDRVKMAEFDECLNLTLDKSHIFRVGVKDSFMNYKDFPYIQNKIKYKGVDVDIETMSECDTYSLIIYFKHLFTEYTPVILDDDLFLKITVDEEDRLSKEDIEIIFNAFIFELSASHEIKLIINPRPYITDDDFIEEFKQDEYKLRPLLFGKGLDDVIYLFNNAEESYDNDKAILEYVKVIEYVSQTIINIDFTDEIRKKLNDNRALKPDANYIKELGETVVSNQKKYSKDRDKIKATIKKCCDIYQLREYLPNYCTKMIKLDNTKTNNKKTQTIDEAFNELCDAVSDTRDELSHAKANYTRNGKECPDNEKDKFVILLRNICVQVIRWFAHQNEYDRIVNIK
ncbi:hypothetical protein QTI99_05915 [Clostridium perfringens]|uniref:hypothetical protein n=1 Tax=Clostridium perfringens TaxID=1502 RepID=UPI002911274F|nr:hypothetical protein [Clostridium perfringens]EJT6170658.1 hypothetical protein [Clostridium perfringens]EJT6541383.1 hypothetical protein [Clostridium perfringens]EJT6566390.1 hypothetical protein [Clostridium perfringens]MBS5994875.1 hypothetical protein [Clostridium perfringens]MDM0996997.1 hypothetical protein [Clostridium perfringens]